MKLANQGELIEVFGELKDCACNSCTFETTELYKIQDYCEFKRGMERETFYCCLVCCTTFAANAMRYPSQYQGEKETMKVLALCTNMILKAIKDKENG